MDSLKLRIRLYVRVLQIYVYDSCSQYKYVQPYGDPEARSLWNSIV
jgi:hypothetical protein